MKKKVSEEKAVTLELDEKKLLDNCVFLGDRKVVLPFVKEKAEKYFKDITIFEVEKLNISVDDIRRMISFVNRTSEGVKVILLSSFYWADEAQNAILKVLEETPDNTHIYLFGLSQKNFLKTVLSRLQKMNFSNTNRYLGQAKEILALPANERLENKNVKKVLGLKVVDYNFERNIEVEKKDREAHILFLQALIGVVLSHFSLPLGRGNTQGRDEGWGGGEFKDKLLKISTLAEIEGGSPHLFIEWLLLSAPQIRDIICR